MCTTVLRVACLMLSVSLVGCDKPATQEQQDELRKQIDEMIRVEESVPDLEESIRGTERAGFQEQADNLRASRDRVSAATAKLKQLRATMPPEQTISKAQIADLREAMNASTEARKEMKQKLVEAKEKVEQKKAGSK